ncbi:MAG TPA: serine/threonine-protein kinase [Myxococcales bacterium]|nr:serine/threonine-protein kinase [Myxococcales bacterium]
MRAPGPKGVLLAGRFETRRRLGAGGLAEVFAATDRSTNTEVAVKLLHAHLARDGATCERFRREVAIARALEHPGIVRVFDLHEHQGRPLISMELLRGRTLHERVLREGPVPPQEARRIALEICCALRAAHHEGVVHRDLKPQNVFLTAAGAVKVLDFGLARIAGQARLTVGDAVAGTPGYIAPEVLAGEGGDARADLYALGAVWFEMLTGRRACDSGALRIEGRDAEVLQRALEPDPERRFLDASQLLRALGGTAVPAPPPAAPPLSAGDYDVLVHDVVRPRAPMQPIESVLQQLGAGASLGWKWRLLGAGQAVLVSGASRKTAEVAAALCAAQGLPVTVRPVSRRPASEEWLARHGGWILALLTGAATAVLCAIFAASYAWVAGALALGYALSWGLRPPASEAPLSGLPAHTSSLLRLADGVARRARVVRARRPALAALAQQAEDAARRAQAAGDDDAMAQRLLEMAASMDDALATPGETNRGSAAHHVRCKGPA